METIVTGDAVVTPHGRIGMAHQIGGDRIQVQFGPDGPFAVYDRKGLKRATAEQVREAGLSGVGGLKVGGKE